MPTVINCEQQTPEWHEAKRGVISGSRLKDIVAKRGGRKLGFYELVAERMGLGDLSSNIDRGNELEPVARDTFAEMTGKKIEEVGFVVSDFNPHIGFSPDGVVYKGKDIVESIEVKCLAAARHLQSVIENEIPKDYYSQVIQPFIVVPTIEKVHYISFDDRIQAKPIHVIEVKREDVEEDIAYYREYQENTLKEIDDIISELTF